MKAAVYQGSQTIVVKQVEMPTVGSNDILAKIMLGEFVEQMYISTKVLRVN